MTTEFQPMPEQPPDGWHIREGADGWYLYTPTMHNKGMLTAPVTIGERRAVREDRWYRDSDGITVYDDGQFRLHPSSILGAKLVTPVNDEWWQEDRNRMPEFGFVRQPADTMPDWAVRRYQRCVSCVPVQRDGVWGWDITWEDE